MFNPIQGASSQIQVDQTSNRPTQQKTQSAGTNAIPQDTATISDAARQAQAANKSTAGGDKDHDGDSH